MTPAAPPLPSAPVHDGVSRLLVLDDQPENLRLIGELLSDTPVELSFAKSGQQALRLADRVAFRIAILDLNLPDIDGFEVGARLRRVQPGCELIYCSAHNDRARRDRAFSEGAIDFIEKPFELGATRRRLRTHLERMSLKIGLQAERDKLDTMIASIPDAIVSVDESQRVVMWNAAAASMFGVREDDALGRDIGDFLPVALHEARWAPDEAQGVQAIDREAPIDLGRVRADGRRIEVEVKRSHWTQDGRPYTTYILRDVTERALLLEALQRAKEDAEQASQAKSTFLATMSHEIRTPMNAVIGMTHLAMRQTPDGRTRDYLEKIQQSARHLLGIINDILDFSKVEADKLVLEHIEFDLDDVLDNFRTLLAERAAAKGVALVCEVAPEVPRQLVGDPLRLAQVLINYGNNAVKFTERGQIRTTVQVTQREGDGVVLRFEVHDTGIGIDAAHLPLLFESFRQADSSTSRRFGGTGLGLAISRRLATLMGGEVGVTSRLGEGSTFWFTARLGLDTPLGRGATSAAAQAPQTGSSWGSASQPALDSVSHAADGRPPASVSGGVRSRGDDAAASAPGDARDAGHTRDVDLQGRRVLVVDDNEINLMIAREMLVHAGLEVVDASDGAQAVARAGEQAFDLVLMDMQMPVMDGLEATRLIRAMPMGPSLPIVAMTANAMATDRDRCLEAGMDDVLTKPIEPDALIAAVRRWVRPRVA